MGWLFQPLLPGSAQINADAPGQGGDPAAIPSLGLVLAPASAITGSLGKTLAAATVAGVARADVAASLGATLAAATVTTKSGTVDVAGTVDKTLGAATLSSGAGVGDIAVVIQTLGAATVSSAATVDIAGALAKTLGAATLATAGGPAIDCALAKTLGGVTFSASGIVGSAGIGQGGDPAPIPSLGLVLQDANIIVGTLGKTLGAVTLSAVGEVPPDELVFVDWDDGPAVAPAYYPHARNVDWWTTDVQLRADVGGVFAVGDSVLAPATSAATGAVDVIGTLAKTLGAATSASAVNVAVDGTVSKTLGTATVSSAGSVDANFVATLSKTLAAATVSAAGGPIADGRVAATLANVTAVGRIDISGGDCIGTLAKTLAPATLATTGGPIVAGGVSKTLDGVSTAIVGSVLVDIVAVTNQVLAAASLSSVVGTVAVELGVRRRHTARATEKKIGGATLRATERNIEGVLVE